MGITLLTMIEIATQCGYSLAHLRRLSSQKKIVPFKREGRKLYFNLDEVKIALKHNVFKAKRLSPTNPLGLAKQRPPVSVEAITPPPTQPVMATHDQVAPKEISTPDVQAQVTPPIESK